MKKDGFKSMPKSILMVCLMIAVLVIVSVIAWKPLRALNLQARAGGKIEHYIQTYAPDFENYFACQIPAFIDLPEDEGLAEAVSLLEKAQALQPENAQTHLLLGRAYCLQKDYEDAIDAFDSYSQERPGSPLGDLERAFAHFTLSLTADNISKTKKAAHETQSKFIIEKHGYSGDYFSKEANNAYKAQAYPNSWYWYHFSLLFVRLDEISIFRTKLMDSIFQKEITRSDLLNNEYIKKVDNYLILQPASFIRLSDGSPIDILNIDGHTVGAYWFNVDPGGVLLNVSESGRFCITIQALDWIPEPTFIEVLMDYKQLIMVKLLTGDKEWRSFKVDTHLNEGIHLLSVRLTNNQVVDGIDRNGYIGDIIIYRCNN